MFCLPKKQVDTFTAKIKDGTIDPVKLLDMTSEARRSLFKDVVGETNATKVNALFESKLLLKNQQQGIINWAKQLTGLKPEVQRDILSRVERMTEVLQPHEADAFLSDLAAQKLGVHVTLEEASKIAELAKNAQEKKLAVQGGSDRLEYGRAKVAFDNYVNELKLGVKQKLTPFKALSSVGGLAKSLKASLDNSVIGRQGLKVLLTNPGTWLKNSIKSFQDIARVFGGKTVMDEVRADVMSRPNALNGLYKKEGLDVGVTEEAYPTHFPEKIPGLGRAFKASETAFTAFQYRTRADIFDKYVEIAQKSGGDIEGLGRIANALTGRGFLGNYEPALKAVNNLFFSPRLLKSNIDALTGHAFDRNFSSFARKQAAINTVKIISGVAGILTVANAVKPGSVEKDPRSADFGKIKIGDTRFDVSGGMGAVVTLASRLITMSSKSSVSGQVSALNSGKFGAATGVDVVVNFLENKLSPAAAVVKDILAGKDFQGNKPTLLGETSNLLMPLPIANYVELKNNPNSANMLAAVLADTLGISVNTYSATTDWTQNPGAELQQFRKKVGDTSFQNANALYNTRVAQEVKKLNAIQKFTSLSNEEQAKVITEQKSKIKETIFKQYGFKYKPTKSKIPKF